MDVREKLIGLIANAKHICANDYSDHTEDEYIADTLLDNGVTVQNGKDINVPSKWIPVTERLPETPDGWAENPEPVLYMMKNTKTIYAGYYGEGGVWRDKYFRQYADSREGVDADDVLCWMWQHDLPEPPKGE